MIVLSNPCINLYKINSFKLIPIFKEKVYICNIIISELNDNKNEMVQSNKSLLIVAFERISIPLDNSNIPTIKPLRKAGGLTYASSKLGINENNIV